MLLFTRKINKIRGVGVKAYILLLLTLNQNVGIVQKLSYLKTEHKTQPMKTKITPFRDRKQNKSFILDEPFDKALKMIIYSKEKGNKKVLISKAKYSDGINYYIDKFVKRGIYTFHIGMIINKKPIHSLKKAKEIANKYLNVC